MPSAPEWVSAGLPAIGCIRGCSATHPQQILSQGRFRVKLTDFTTWAGIFIGIATLVVAYLAYRSQRGKTRLEFVVVINTSVAVVKPVSASLAVAYDGKVVPDASVAVIRLVNTGDKAIRAADYSSDLVICLDNINEVVAATATKTRPTDLKPKLNINGTDIAIAPLLINPGDMIELQLLTSGLASSVRVEGRIANLSRITQRKGLPYPPGSGTEGEMLGFDKFMWFVFAPVFFVGSIIAAILFAKLALSTKVITLFVVSILGFVLYPMQVKYLVERRRMWRP
jgi:hypothetical protein